MSRYIHSSHAHCGPLLDGVRLFCVCHLRLWESCTYTGDDGGVDLNAGCGTKYGGGEPCACATVECGDEDIRGSTGGT